MKYFNPKTFKRRDMVRLEAEAINRCLGATFQPAKSHRLDDRALCERVVGPVLKGETKQAYGSVERCKGGVIPGRRAFE